MPHKLGVGAIKGIVSEDGVVSQKRILLVDRSTLKIVAVTESDEGGAYIFNGLNADTNDYLVVGVDDSPDVAGDYKQAMVFDRVKPFSAHIGSIFYGNWYFVSKSKDPIAAWFGDFDSSVTRCPIVLGNSRALARTNYNGLSTYQAPTFVGAPHIATLTTIASNLIFYSASDGGHYSRTTAKEFTLETVIVKSRCTGNVGLGAYNGGGNLPYLNSGDNYNYNSKAPAPAINYNKSTDRLNVYAYSTGSPLSSSGVSASTTTYMSNIDLSPYGDVVHIIVAYKLQDDMCLYINGQLVTTVSLLSTGLDIDSTRKAPLGIIISNDAVQYWPERNNVANMTGGVGAIAWYDRKLTADSVNEHYQALILGTIAKVSGVCAEYVVDHPLYYYRLNDSGGNNYFEQVGVGAGYVNNRRAAHIFNPSAITYQVPSLGVGGLATRFNGGGARNVYGYNPNNATGYSMAFIAKFDSATPSQNELVAVVTGSDTSVYRGVYRTTANKFYVQDTTYRTFNYAIDYDNFHMYHVVIDKIKGEARLYVDGSLVETITIDKTLLATYSGHDALSSADIVNGFSIAGMVPSSLGSITNPFKGVLGEVAFFDKILTKDRIQAHYKALELI
ncbi:LamG-like jellyroll fold domain-containing protein [Acinetobacter sp. 16]|uniref:LamG-like jellyroll fold domain-containing protein n=1 Tax=Acinetobacter sp. 16 TaxID=3081771 RepID=UPI00296F9E5B|nr:LamG-like jellyroll fold domain-containing protein [Acinetobacter sp. 16]